MRLHNRLTRAAGTWSCGPDLTGRAPQDGWLRNEDVGRLDKDGSLFVVGEIVYLAETGTRPTAAAPLRRPT